MAFSGIHPNISLFSIFLGIGLPIFSLGCADIPEKMEDSIPVPSISLELPQYIKTLSFRFCDSGQYGKEMEQAIFIACREVIHSAYPYVSWTETSADAQVSIDIGPSKKIEKPEEKTAFHNNIATLPYTQKTGKTFVRIMIPIRLVIQDSQIEHTFWDEWKTMERESARSDELPPSDSANEPALSRSSDSADGEKLRKSAQNFVKSWMESIFYSSPSLQKVSLFRTELQNMKIWPSIQNGQIEHAIVKLTSIVHFMLELKRKQILTRSEWKRLAIVYDTRATLLKLLGREDTSRRDFECAKNIFLAIGY